VVDEFAEDWYPLGPVVVLECSQVPPLQLPLPSVVTLLPRGPVTVPLWTHAPPLQVVLPLESAA
jgi:hypothetical protein